MVPAHCPRLPGQRFVLHRDGLRPESAVQSAATVRQSYFSATKNVNDCWSTRSRLQAIIRSADAHIRSEPRRFFWNSRTQYGVPPLGGWTGSHRLKPELHTDGARQKGSWSQCVRKSERGLSIEPEGRARHSVRAACWQCRNGAQRTDAPYQLSASVDSGGTKVARRDCPLRGAYNRAMKRMD